MLPVSRSRIGLLVTIASITCFFVGEFASVRRLASVQRFALWGAVFGGVWYILGSTVVRCIRFPLLFLALAIPPPYFVLGDIRLLLKEFATRLSAEILLLMGAPAAPEGNMLLVGDHQFEVADACSGIRSLMAILTTAVFVGYLVKSGFWKGILLCAMAIPVTIAVNIVRILTVAIAFIEFDIDLSSGWSHDLLGYTTYALSFALLFGIWWLLDWRSIESPAPPESDSLESAV